MLLLDCGRVSGNKISLAVLAVLLVVLAVALVALAVSLVSTLVCDEYGTSARTTPDL